MTDLADREWRLIREESWDGPTNMALDEVAAETAAAGGPRTLRVYRWEPSTLSLGYHQDRETIDWRYAEREGITVTRRPTGGGGIYHDSVGDVSYSIVAPAAELPSKLIDSYHLLCEPVLLGFSRMGVDARFVDEPRPEIHHPACYLRALHPAHDVVAGEEGKKVSGNAQYRQREAVIQHGSLTYEVRTEPHLAVFRNHDIEPETFEERVTGIHEESGIPRDEAVRALETALAEWADAEEGSWTEVELDRAEEIAEAKYDDDRWTRERIDPTG